MEELGYYCSTTKYLNKGEHPWLVLCPAVPLSFAGGWFWQQLFGADALWASSLCSGLPHTHRGSVSAQEWGWHPAPCQVSLGAPQVYLLSSARCPTVSQLPSSCPRVSLWLLSTRSRDLIFLQGRSILHRAGWSLGQLCTLPLNSAGKKTVSKSELGWINGLLKGERKQNLTVSTVVCLQRILAFIVCLFCKAYISRRTWLSMDLSASNTFFFCTWVERAQKRVLQHVALPQIYPPHSWPCGVTWLCSWAKVLEKPKLSPWPPPSPLSSSVLCLCTKSSWNQAKIVFGVQENPKKPQNTALWYYYNPLFPFPFLLFSHYEEICPTFTPPQVTPHFISNVAELEVHHNTSSALANAQLLIQFLVSLAWLRKVDSLTPAFCQVLVPPEQRLGHLLMIHWKNWFYDFPWAWESFFKEKSCSLWDDHPKMNDCQRGLVKGSA